MRALGIDVSHYQGEVPWHQLANTKVKFAFAKATEGTASVDPELTRNWPRIQEAGLFRGAYHFARPGQDPEAQAVHFASVVGALGFRDLPPVLDLEVDDKQPARNVLDWAQAFLLKAESLFGRKLIVYTGGFWRGKLENPQIPFFGERALWLAAYGPAPVVPNSWTKWTFWQFTEGTHNGPIEIPGLRACDQNWFDGGEDELNALCSGQIPAPAPVPPATPANDWPGTYFTWPHAPAMAGASIRQWQIRVSERGFKVDPDGVYGPQSKVACLAFQRDQGLPADGIVGPTTWAATFAVQT